MPETKKGGGFVDRFVTLLGYEVDTKGLTKFKMGLDSLKKKVNSYANTTRKASASSRRAMARDFASAVRAIRHQLSIAVTAIKKWRKDNEKQIKKVGESFDKLKDRGSNLLSFFGKLGGATLGALGGFSALLGMTNTATTRIEALSKALGVNANVMRGIGETVKPLGLDYENVSDLIEELNNKMGESTGLGEPMTAVKESLEILKLDYADLKKLAPEDQFIRIMDSAKELGDVQQSVSAVDMLMGGEANRIMGMLRGTNKSMSDLVRNKMKLSTLDRDGRAGAEAFTASLNDASLVATSMKDQFMGLVGKGLKPMLDEFIRWAVANKEVIKTRIAEYAQKIVDNLSDMVAWLKEMTPKVEELVDALGGLKGIIHGIKVALGAVIVVKIILFLKSVYSAIASVISVLISLKPVFIAIKGVIVSFGAGVLATVTAVVAGIAVFAYAMYDLYRYFDGQETMFSNWGNAIGDAMWSATESMLQAWDDFKPKLKEGMNRLVSWLNDKWVEVASFASYVVDYWKGVFNDFIVWVSDLPSRIAKGIKSGAGEIKDSISSTFTDIGDFFSGGHNVNFNANQGMGNISTASSGKSVRQNNNLVINAPQNTSPEDIAIQAKKTLQAWMANALDTEGVPQT